MSLLFKFRPLVINPELAERVGLNEAIVLQQLNYWLTETDSGVESGGRRWIYNTYDKWAGQFPFWSVETVKRTFTSLEKSGVVLAEKLQKAQRDHTKFYSIDFEHPLLSEQVKMTSSNGSKPPQSEEVKMTPSNGSDCSDVNGSICSDLLTENTHKTTTETTTENTARGGGDSLPEVLPKSKHKTEDANVPNLPDWIPVDSWIGFVNMRKSMGARGKLTERAAMLIVKELEKLREQGHDAGDVLDQSTVNNWRGVFPVKSGHNRQQALEQRNRQAAEDFVRGNG